MKALTVQPGVADSASIAEIGEPDVSEGAVLVEGLAVGVCGTDLEIMANEYGEAPPDEDRLVLGHESLGRVIEDSSGTFAPGDLVVGIVRVPDPVPCVNCAAGEADMCDNGQYTEHGIKGLHGFARERYRLRPECAVALDASLSSVGVLMEPLTIVTKAWEQIKRIGARATFAPHTVLVTGAGPIGQLAAMLGVREGLDVHVFDQRADGPKPELVQKMGAIYHYGAIEDLPVVPDIVLECTGAPALVVDVMSRNGANGIVCLTGVSTRGRTVPFDAGGFGREAVLENDVVFGSVNANRRHYLAAAITLAEADRGWLESLITRRVPLANFAETTTHRDDDIKAVIEIGT